LPGLARRGDYDRELGAVMNRFPETDAQAREQREMLDARVEYAELRDVNLVRRQVAARELDELIATRRVVAQEETADRRSFDHRVRDEAERRIAALKAAS